MLSLTLPPGNSARSRQTNVCRRSADPRTGRQRNDTRGRSRNRVLQRRFLRLMVVCSVLNLILIGAEMRGMTGRSVAT